MATLESVLLALASSPDADDVAVGEEAESLMAIYDQGNLQPAVRLVSSPEEPPSSVPAKGQGGKPRIISAKEMRRAGTNSIRSLANPFVYSLITNITPSAGPLEINERNPIAVALLLTLGFDYPNLAPPILSIAPSAYGQTKVGGHEVSTELAQALVNLTKRDSEAAFKGIASWSPGPVCCYETVERGLSLINDYLSARPVIEEVELAIVDGLPDLSLLKIDPIAPIKRRKAREKPKAIHRLPPELLAHILNFVEASSLMRTTLSLMRGLPRAPIWQRALFTHSE